MSLVPKMAQSTDEVLAFLRELGARAKPFAEREYAELEAFARDELGLPDLAPWDVAYVSEKQKAKRYAFSEQEVRQYFPEDRVLAGLFRVVETIYGITIRESRAPTWHDSVRFFDITDRHGALVGQFYLDMYARGTSRAARGWTMRSTAAARARTCSIRSPTSHATCRRRSTASRRRSRTTRSSPSSTSSATGCTTC